MKVCLPNIKNAFPNLDREMIEGLLNEINTLRAKTPDRATLYAKLRERIASNQKAHLGKAAELIYSEMAHMNNLDVLSNPKFNDIDQAFQSLMTNVATSVGDNVGLNVENILRHTREKYTVGFEMDLRNEGLFDIFMSGELDQDIMKVATKDPSVSPAFKETAEKIYGIIKNKTDKMYHDLNTQGLVVPYKEDFLLPVFHSGEKITKSFSGWVNKLIDTMDFEKTFIKESSSVTLKDINEFISDVKSGKVDLEKALLDRRSLDSKATKYKNSLFEELAEDFAHWNRVDNMKSGEDGSPILELTYYKGKNKTLAEVRGSSRSYQWKDSASKQAYLEEFGKYKTLGETYAAYAARTAKDVAFVSVFGPTPYAGIQRLLDHVDSQPIPMEQKKKIRQTAETNYAILVNGAPRPQSTIGQRAKDLNDITSAAYNGNAAIATLLDIAPSIVHQVARSNDNMVSGSLKFIGNYFKAFAELADPVKKQEALREAYIHTGTWMEELKKILNSDGSFMSKAARSIFVGFGGAHLNNVIVRANYLGYIATYKDSVLSKNYSKVMGTELSKFGLVEQDLDVIAKLFNYANTPQQFYNIPTSHFENNHRGLSAEAYRELLADRANMHLRFITESSSSQAGVRERRQLLGNNYEVDSPFGIGMSMFSQFKSPALKIVNEYNNLNRMQQGTDQFTFKNGDSWKMFGHMLAVSAAVGSFHYVLSNLLKGKTPDEIQEEFNNRPVENAAYVLLRANMGSIYGDFFIGASRPEDIASKILTPSIKTALEVPSFAYNSFQQLEEEDDFTRAQAANITRFTRGMIPGGNFFGLQFFMKHATDAEFSQKYIIENLDQSIEDVVEFP